LRKMLLRDFGAESYQKQSIASRRNHPDWNRELNRQRVYDRM
jgi:hypothetical protein